MAEELAKISKPKADSFQKGRRLLLVPLIYGAADAPAPYPELCEKYWGQVNEQVAELERKLGTISRCYHELIPAGGDDGCQAIAELNEKSHELVAALMKTGASLEEFEEAGTLSEFMDWTRCLASGLQNPDVIGTVYEHYLASHKKRAGELAARIEATLKEDELGLVLLRENHQVQFPPDVEVFYVAPPALDEIGRWLRTAPAAANEGEAPAE